MNDVAYYIAGLVTGHVGGQVEVTCEVLDRWDMRDGFIAIVGCPSTDSDHHAYERWYMLGEQWQHHGCMPWWLRGFELDGVKWLIGDGDDTKASVEDCDEGLIYVWVRRADKL